MSILVGDNTRLVVQGFTGSEGTFHSGQMIEYGTKLVGGVTPGKRGQTHRERPVFNIVREAVEKEGAKTSNIFVPQPCPAEAIMAQAYARTEFILCMTDGIPVRDMPEVYYFGQKISSRLIGS